MQNIDRKPTEATEYHLAALIYENAYPEPILMTTEEVDRCIERTERQPEDVPEDWEAELRQSVCPVTQESCGGTTPYLVAALTMFAFFFGACGGYLLSRLIH